MENLGRSWTCSHQSSPRPFRRSRLVGDTRPQHRLDYSLVAGSRRQNLLETRAARRWRKPPGSSSYRNLLWLPTSPPWRRLRKIYQLRQSPHLHRRLGRTRSGGCARLCDDHSGCSLPSAHYTLIFDLEGRTNLLPFLVYTDPRNSQYAFTTHTLFPHFMTYLIIFAPSQIQLALSRTCPSL